MNAWALAPAQFPRRSMQLSDSASCSEHESCAAATEPTFDDPEQSLARGESFAARAGEIVSLYGGRPERGSWASLTGWFGAVLPPRETHRGDRVHRLAVKVPQPNQPRAAAAMGGASVRRLSAMAAKSLCTL
jgi:hypothetical protein